MDKTSFSIPMADFEKLPSMRPAGLIDYLKSRGRLYGFPITPETAVTLSFRPDCVVAHFITPRKLDLGGGRRYP